jgi:hypothetical protein
MRIVVERNVPVPLRDGTVLRANVHRAEGAGRRPVLIFRTPYDKNSPHITSMAIDALRAVEAGYVVVHQDVRGRHASDGSVFHPFASEFSDGHDTVEWAANQTWSSGRVGVFGTSYHGFTSWAAAVSRPPALRAIAASQSPNRHHGLYWRGGAFQLGLHAHWSARVLAPHAIVRADHTGSVAALESLAAGTDDFPALTGVLPPRSMLSDNGAIESALPYFREVFDHPDPADHFHRSRSIAGRHRDIEVPALVVAGWNDPLLNADLEHWAALGESPDAVVRESSRLVIGPWTHGIGMHSVAASDLSFGLASSGLAIDLRDDLTSMHLAWFDRWLTEKTVGGNQDRVRIFVMGENRWRSENEWPLSRARTGRWFLHSDGGLSERGPDRDAEPLVFQHDPERPVPTAGGGVLLPAEYRPGTVSQADNVQRSDVLVFTSEILADAVKVIGQGEIVLSASSTAVSADWIVKLCDVHPDGRTFNVSDGIVRHAQAGGTGSTAAEVPARLRIELNATAIVFLPGHRLRVIISSSDFPRFDRNPGTGEFSLEAPRLRPATQRVFCDAERASWIELPLVVR